MNAWENEPNELDWTEELSGLNCALRRGPLHHWCGYVQIPKGHPWHGIGYSDMDVNVHWGLTYSGDRMDDGNFWIGFDCAHSGDLVPGLAQYRMRDPSERYRDLEYTKTETESVARQVANAVIA